MFRQKRWYFFGIMLISLSFCTSPQVPKEEVEVKEKNEMENGIAIAHLAAGDDQGLKDIQQAFAERNPGYTLDYAANQKKIEATDANRVVFIQTGGGTATLNNGKSSKFSIGDILMLDPGESLTTDSLFSYLEFTVPHTPPNNIPTFVRPDWDMNITDTPGGCATETNAYRRILLTWKDKVGPYLFHSINAHRVRIMDSFTHYHPKEGGFDEFYLVQMAQAKARLITSDQVGLIENPLSVSKEQSQSLLHTTPLQVGDLIYLPRGVAHRGIDGVLAQVITVPGFVPGSEVGVDHHLKAINENLNLEAPDQLPYNKDASNSAVIK